MLAATRVVGISSIVFHLTHVAHTMDLLNLSLHFIFPVVSRTLWHRLAGTPALVLIPPPSSDTEEWAFVKFAHSLLFVSSLSSRLYAYL